MRYKKLDADIHQVHFLSTADYITVLEEGRVSKGQVSYDSVEPSVWGVIENETKNKANETSEATKEAKDPSPIDLQTSEVTAKVEKDLSRQTGDSECYTIYLKSLGRQVIAVLIVGTVLHAVLTKMPRRLAPHRRLRTDADDDSQRSG